MLEPGQRARDDVTKEGGAWVQRHEAFVERVVEHTEERGDRRGDAVAIVDPIPGCGEFEAACGRQMRAQRQILGAFGSDPVVGPRREDDVRILGIARAIARSRSEEHTSELQSLMRISYAVFSLKKKNTNNI